MDASVCIPFALGASWETRSFFDFLAQIALIVTAANAVMPIMADGNSGRVGVGEVNVDGVGDAEIVGDAEVAKESEKTKTIFDT